MSKNILNTLNNFGRKLIFKGKKFSPEILAGLGTVGVIAGTVLACKSTTKASTIIEEAKEEIAKIHEVIENPDKYDVEYTEEDSKKDLTKVYGISAIKLVKAYLPSAIVTGLSIGALLGSNHILKKRNIALSAAYSTVSATFKKYRKNVVDRFGTEIDKELRYNIKEAEVKSTDENGKEVTKTTKVGNIDCNVDYSRFFDAASPYWETVPEYNLMFLNHVQSQMNDKLRAQKYLFLNDVYIALGIEPTKAGQVVGWVYDEENPIGDNCVDFGIYDVHDERKRAFVNGWEENILLDFNVDGNILDLLQ